MNTLFKSTAPGLALALLATTAISTAASAADLPVRRAPVYAPPPPIPVFTWTGFYAGVQVGYEFGRSSGAIVAIDPASGFAPGTVVTSNSGSKNGVIGGAHVGYLFSTQSLPVVGSFFGGNGAFGFGTGGVFGIEGDVDGTSARTNYVFPASGGFTSNSSERIQGSIRGRLGIAFDRVLLYATGGAAFGSFQNTYFNPGIGTDSFSRTRVGYTVGGGVEYAFTNNLSARVEYRYTDFGSYQTVLSANTTVVGGLFAVRQRETDNRVQAGLSYKFETIVPAPVVARY